LTYINDIVTRIDSNIRLFTDDTSLYISVETPEIAASKLNHDLQQVHEWSKSWLVTFNPAKTESMIFSKKTKKPDHLPLYLNGVPITQVKIHKHLGLTISDDAKWDTHISLVIQKAWKRIGIMRSLKFFLSRSNLEKMYISFVRPIIEYSNEVWDNCSNFLKNEIELIHHEAARIVSGATKLCNINKLLNDMKWDSLEKRRKNHKLILFYEMQNNLTPSYLTDLLPSNNAVGAYNLRNTRSVNARTESYRFSFLP